MSKKAKQSRPTDQDNRLSLVIIDYSSVDEGLTPTKDGGTCLRRLSMFRKEVH